MAAVPLPALPEGFPSWSALFAGIILFALFFILMAAPAPRAGAVNEQRPDTENLMCSTAELLRLDLLDTKGAVIADEVLRLPPGTNTTELLRLMTWTAVDGMLAGPAAAGAPGNLTLRTGR